MQQHKYMCVLGASMNLGVWIRVCDSNRHEGEI